MRIESEMVGQTRRGFWKPALTALVLMAGALLVSCKPAPPAGMFASPEQATEALVAALRKKDKAALAQLFGPGGEPILDSGDPVADESDRVEFLAAYDKKHALIGSGKHSRTLQIGERDWPLPVPLVHKDGFWRWDGAAGAEELVFRRIGENELQLIRAMQTYVEAQLEYAAQAHDDQPAGLYARRLMSTPGTQDGLYWPAVEGETESPIGPLIAEAGSEGYSAPTPGADSTAPYHGYRLRMLLAAGPAADGGARDYLVDGKLTGGFSLLAVPAEYGNSGIMSFMVDQHGVVFQTDLGADTATVAAAITVFDPGEGWAPVPAESMLASDQAGE
jgi:hypothetical protein